MNRSFVSTGAVVAIALFTNLLRADDQPAATQTGDLLGHTYTSLGVTADHYRNLPGGPDGFGTVLDLNLPVADNFDYALGCDFTRANSHHFSDTDTELENEVTAYAKFKRVSPFVSAGFGYDWEHIKSQTTPLSYPGRFDRLGYDVDAGLEFPVSQSLSLRTQVGQDDSSLRKPHVRDLDYGLSANCWWGPTLGTFVGAQMKDGHGGALNTTEYTAGVRFALE